MPRRSRPQRACRPRWKRRRGDVVEMPGSVVPPQLAATGGRREKDIEFPIPIHVTQRDAGTVEQHLIGQMTGGRNDILERDSRFTRLDTQEQGLRIGARGGKRTDPAIMVPESPPRRRTEINREAPRRIG